MSRLLISALVAALGGCAAPHPTPKLHREPAEGLRGVPSERFREQAPLPGPTPEQVLPTFQKAVLRNGLTVTATDKTFLDDGGAGEWKKPLTDDGTTYTEGEGTTP